MIKDWTLREEAYRSLHQWPVIIVYFAAGCLLGWILSLLWPATYRATAQIYVGFNAYRAWSDTTFLTLANPKYSNVDDYKNWQMYQLEALVFHEEFLEETLENLRQQDAYWQEVDSEGLWDMLEADWRSAGTWSLVAEHRDPQRASQAAQAWSAVVIERVKEATLSARDTFMLEEELQQIATEFVQSSLREDNLISTKAALEIWIDGASKLPQDQPLDSLERWYLLSLASSAADFTPVWMALLDSQPPPDAPPSAYLDWLARITSTIDAELETLEPRIAPLEAQKDELAERYSQASDASYGISPNIAIEELKILPVEVVRPTSLLVLVGGIVGLCLWILRQLVRITNRELKEP